MEDRLKRVFAQALRISIERVSDGLKYDSIPEWTSVGHMVLITAIDSEFGIMLDTEDIIDMSSFKKAKEILTNKYGVKI